MQAKNPHLAAVREDRTQQRGGVVVELKTLARTRDSNQSRPLRCVWTGYLTDGCSCDCTVPAAVARAAWAREQELECAGEDSLFHFAWRGEVWLGYGLAGGEIRGVYCPTHRAAREAHAAGRRSRQPLPFDAAVAVG